MTAPTVNSTATRTLALRLLPIFVMALVLGAVAILALKAPGSDAALTRPLPLLVVAALLYVHVTGDMAERREIGFVALNLTSGLGVALGAFGALGLGA